MKKLLLSKVPLFCPVPRDKLQEDWEKFENRLRAATFFFSNCDINSSLTDEEREPIFPTVKKVLSWKAPVSKVPEIELFLESAKKELFNPTNVSIVHDNLSIGEKKALFQPSKFLVLLLVPLSDKACLCAIKLHLPGDFHHLHTSP